jgi:hypothetical protein
LWKPKAPCELNAQLASFPNQTGLLPEDEMKSAIINLCMPDWQQEFLKTEINEHSSSSWNKILSKAEALEQAELAIVKLTSTKETKREREDGEVVSDSKPSAKKKAKPSFFCDQKHNSDTCKVLNAEIEKIKLARKKPSSNCNDNPPNNQRQSNNKSNNNAKSSWTDAKFHVDSSKQTAKSRCHVTMGRDLLSNCPQISNSPTDSNMARSHHPHENSG